MLISLETMEPEQQNGNIEYKLKLIGKSEQRIEGLASQMRFRCEEGGAECIYNIGVEDDGTIIGVTPLEFEETLRVLNTAADKNSYVATLLATTLVEDDKRVYEVLVREHNDNKYIDIKVAVAGNVDVGKCEKIGTVIRLYPSGTKEIQDITTTDLLMGDDSTPRKVLETTSGHGQMYEIIPVNGKSFTVNKNHILCMKASNYNYTYLDKSRERWCVRRFMYKDCKPKITMKGFFVKQKADEYLEQILNEEGTIKYGDVVELSLEHYVNLKKMEKSALKLYRVGIDYSEQEVDLDPYLVGYWLGDGTSSASKITTSDQEIVDCFNHKLHEYNLQMKKVGQSKYTYGISSLGKTNHFLNTLRKYDLLNNKHIPDCYKYSSRKARLALMAGLIDSDGYKHPKYPGYDFTMTRKNETLCNDMVEVIRSLGFASYPKYVIKICTNGANGPTPTPCDCVSFRIDGEGIEQIPCIIPRKVSSSRKSLKNTLVTGIKKINVLEDQSYFGFELDGNGKYLHEDFTVTHNSSFLGVMTSGKFDDGRGSARLSVFNFPHEVKTGRTSSIGHHILGFDEGGTIVNYRGVDKMSWPEIVRGSAKVISFFDLAGHAKYLKTTILGLASSNPDLCLIMVGANKGIRNEKDGGGRGRKKKYENMTREHIFLCITLKIPFALIVTKIDMMEERQTVLNETMSDIQKIIKCPGVRRQPIRVETDDDVLICAKQVHTESVVPIFTVSNVSGQGIDKVKMFLNVLGKTTPRRDNVEEVEYHIDSTWTVPGVGTVTGGHLITGTIKVNDKLLIGPNNGLYEQAIVRSIHCKRVPLQTVSHGSYVCLGLKKFNRGSIRRGNVMISEKSQQVFCQTFSADVKVMRSHSTTIRLGYEPVVHASSIRQTASLLAIKNKINSRNPDSTNDDGILRTGDTATVTFKLRYQPEFIIPGMRILLAEGITKVVGVVKTVNPAE